MVLEHGMAEKMLHFSSWKAIQRFLFCVNRLMLPLLMEKPRFLKALWSTYNRLRVYFKHKSQNNHCEREIEEKSHGIRAK